MKMSNTELLDCRNIIRAHGVDDEAVWAFCCTTHMPSLPLDLCKEKALAVLDLCDYPRTIPIRRGEVIAARTSEHIENIIRETISNGIMYKFKGLK